MIILGDIGNTETKICLVNKNKIIKKILLPSKGKKFNILDKHFKNFQFLKLQKILFCSVVPSTFKEIKSYFAKKTKIRCFELKELNVRSILKIEVNYKQVGSDRLANALGVSSKNKNFIILDFGTATTFDILIGNNYKGGIISPGIRLSLNTLSDKATLIPKINLKKISKIIGKDTKTAVRSGFFWGYAGLIDNILNLIKKETKKSFKVIITGGFSELFKNSVKTKTKQDLDVTINGLNRASKLIK